MGFWILAGAHSFLGFGLAGWMYGITTAKETGRRPSVLCTGVWDMHSQRLFWRNWHLLLYSLTGRLYSLSGIRATGPRVYLLFFYTETANASTRHGAQKEYMVVSSEGPACTWKPKDCTKLLARPDYIM